MRPSLTRRTTPPPEANSWASRGSALLRLALRLDAVSGGIIDYAAGLSFRPRSSFYGRPGSGPIILMLIRTSFLCDLKRIS